MMKTKKREKQVNIDRRQRVKERALGLIKVLSFVLVFLVLLESVSLFILVYLAPGYTNHIKDTYSFMYEPKDTIDIISVGNSNMYAGFTPLEMWNDFGYTSVVCASPMQSIGRSLVYTKMAIKAQKPKLVIIETDIFFDHKPEQKNSREETKKTEFFENFDTDKFDGIIEATFSLFEFHNGWKNGFQSTDKFQFETHGYRFNTNIYELQPVEYMIPTDECEEIPKKNIKEMNALIDICTKNDVNVLFVSIPTLVTWTYERHNAVSDYAKEKGIDFIDFNLDYEKAGISLTTGFRDRGNHLNDTSATQATKYIGEFIKGKYGLVDKRNDSEFEAWNENYKLYLETLKKEQAS